ncbi:MAG: hypothetical protein ALECFALPRED_000979 [Alectoria fallacina]|uniref:Chromo domain-containing protein n=1 Tax=Alectoria fallacina TaxID=1903189 RepID=A0A8H3IFR3_9LECA|nr:MAG: hypothetical protein ALECFALPRED_000979 [Alectoria fallacina]
MDAAGYMGHNRYTIYHPDLLQSPGNVMIKFSPDKSLSVSGILDWDGAVFYPSFYGCEIPIWIWDGEYKDDESNRSLEKAVVPGYPHRARAPRYGLARELIPWAESERIGNQGPDKTANDFLDVWEIIRPPGTPPIPRIEKTPSNKIVVIWVPSEASCQRKTLEKAMRKMKNLTAKAERKPKRPPSSSEADREEEYEVDRVVVNARRFARGQVKYKIKSTGYDELTWQPILGQWNICKERSESSSPRTPANPCIVNVLNVFVKIEAQARG